MSFSLRRMKKELESLFRSANRLKKKKLSRSCELPDGMWQLQVQIMLEE
jgi:hypothetical protein